MPELPEVETVKETLKKEVLNRTIKDVIVYYDGIIAYPSKEEFVKNIRNQKINDIKRKGKFLMFELDDYYLLSHLRMEGRYYIRDGEKLKHEHVRFILNDKNLCYIDTRKFGRMHLIPKDIVYSVKPLSDLGLEPWDENLTVEYLKEKYKNKKLPIKTVLLDQSIITGIGNIYDDEILFLSKINPYKKACDLTKKNLEDIIINTRDVLEHAIKLGGTTIRTYESSEGIHGLFQHELLIHGRSECSKCNNPVTKEFIGGRGTYYCKKCQK